VCVCARVCVRVRIFLYIGVCIYRTMQHSFLLTHIKTFYGVAMIKYRSFCRKYSLLWGSFAKETYNFKEPSN